jgi:hypothetical protein
MNYGQSEQQKSIKKAMKIHEIVSSDKAQFAECKNDLMTKIAMGEDDAEEVAHSMRDMFLPKLMKAEGIEEDDMPEDFVGEMAEDDDDFEIDKKEEDEDHADEEEEDDDDEFNFSDDDEEHEDDINADEPEVDADEIATIHIKVPIDKIREIEKALETVLDDTDAISKDHAIGQKEKTQGDKEMNKNIEARMALRKKIVSAMAEDSEVEHVSRKEGFDHAKDAQYKEEDFYTTAKGSLTDPDFDTLDYNKIEIPNFKDLIDGFKPDLGLNESLTVMKFDGTPSDAEDFELDFNPFEVPSQGKDGLYHDLVIPSEGKIPRKRVVSSTALGEFDTEAAEEALAFALKTAGVEEEDLGKLTYAEGLDLFKAIKTAEADRKHYSKDGVLDFPQNNPKDPDAKKAATEDALRKHTGTDEEDPTKDHTRKNAFSSTDEQYASMLRKLMKGASEHEHDHEDENVEADIYTSPDGAKMDFSSKEEKSMMKATMDKEAELYKARLKTAYDMSTKLAIAGILPQDEASAYADGMISDNLSVTAMIRQTKILLNSAATTAEKLASSTRATRTASTGVSFNPSVRGVSADLSGVNEIQNALRYLWPTTTPDE